MPSAHKHRHREERLLTWKTHKTHETSTRVGERVLDPPALVIGQGKKEGCRSVAPPAGVEMNSRHRFPIVFFFFHHSRFPTVWLNASDLVPPHHHPPTHTAIVPVKNHYTFSRARAISRSARRLSRLSTSPPPLSLRHEATRGGEGTFSERSGTLTDASGMSAFASRSKTLRSRRGVIDWNGPMAHPYLLYRHKQQWRNGEIACNVDVTTTRLCCIKIFAWIHM